MYEPGDKVRIVSGPFFRAGQEIIGIVTRVVRGVLRVSMWTVKKGAGLVHPHDVERYEGGKR